MGITYSKNGDYFIPEIVLSQQATKPLGKYGRLRLTYLQEHRQALFNYFVLSEKQFHHLSEVDEQAQQLLNTMVPQMAKVAGSTGQRKAYRPNEMGRLDGYRQGTGGGNYICSADFWLTALPTDEEKIADIYAQIDVFSNFI